MLALSRTFQDKLALRKDIFIFQYVRVGPILSKKEQRDLTQKFPESAVLHSIATECGNIRIFLRFCCDLAV